MIWWRPIIRCGQSGRAAFWKSTDAKGVAVLAGEAGTGKSTTLAAVRDAYEVAGYRVIGMSWTNQVVQNLKPDGFRDATTVAAELYRLDRGSTRWDSRTVLIVDEASMLLTKHLAEVTAQTRAAGAKLILAGDDKQLASIERGGLFGELKEQYGGAELHEVVPVSDAEQRRAFNLMHQGEFLPALAIYARQRAIDWSGGQDETRETLVRQWGRDLAAIRTRSVLSSPTPTPTSRHSMPPCAKSARAKGARRRSPAQNGGCSGTLCQRRPDPVYRHRGAPRGPASRIVNGGVGTIRAIEGDRVTVALDGKAGAPERLVSLVAGDDYAAGIRQIPARLCGDDLQRAGAHARSELPLSQRALAQRIQLRRADPASRKRHAACRDRDGIQSRPARPADGAGDDCRAASQFHAQENPERGAPVDLAEPRAQIEEAAGKRRRAQAASERETLTKAALVRSG